MTDSEIVWTRVKETARDLAEAGLVPSDAEARSIVRDLFAKVTFERIPPEAVAFFALELRIRVAEYSMPHFKQAAS